MVLNPTNKAREKEPNLLIIGCDYHPGFQQISFVDTESVPSTDYEFKLATNGKEKS